MDWELLETGDGSHTLLSKSFDEIYHSRKGAKQESEHVFLWAGLEKVLAEKDAIKILEVGFGTGFNCLLTLNKVQNTEVNIDYVGLEPFPVAWEMLEQLNYPKLFENQELDWHFKKIHQLEMNKKHPIETNFQLIKVQQSLSDYFVEENDFDLIYFDAFAPSKQPEMWTIPIFRKCYDLLKNQGIWVTYCAKGQVKRDLKEVGFEIESLQGPPGKREMIRAIKP